MIFNMSGGGGAGLNFKVVGGPSQRTKPESPSLNMIWVDTDTDITGYAFAPIEPTDPTPGFVWFKTSFYSNVSFNALKKNNLQIYPNYASQYIGDAWVEVPAQTYQNDEWVEWYDGELYNFGDEYEDITGGWALSSKYSGTHGDILTKHENTMLFESSVVDGGHFASGFLRPNNKINLSGINYILLFTKSVSNDVENNPVVLCVKTTDNARKADVVRSVNVGSSITETTYTLDVSTLTGDYYVGLEYSSSAGGRIEFQTVKIK